MSPATTTVDPSARASSRQQGRDRHVRRGGEHVLEPGQRVVGDVEAEHLPLERQPLLLVPVRQVRDDDREALPAVVAAQRSAKRSNWPSASLRLTPMTESTACSCTSSRARRAWPRESKAPALMSDSMVRLLQTTAGTLSRKSVKDVNAPFSSRVAHDRVDHVGADVADRPSDRSGCPCRRP